VACGLLYNLDLHVQVRWGKASSETKVTAANDRQG
jgi:hypothetical protein